jgi:hypothetical protein
MVVLFPVRTRIAIGLLLVVGIAAAWAFLVRSRPPKPAPVFVTREEDQRLRLLAEIQPVSLPHCELERFGEKHDGGYLLCKNLLGDVKSAYSYGISGYDQWGCDVSTRLAVPVHEYDCFNLTRPRCRTGKLVFHGECIGDSRREVDGRPFDTLENQIRKNGDEGKRLVVKMDVEGAEWESFLGASADVLSRIDQMAVEFHGFDEVRFVAAMSKLKDFFYIASLHWNNYACDGGRPPYPSWAYEILFVNKRFGVPDPAKPVVTSPLHTPNDPKRPDCQSAPAK